METFLQDLRYAARTLRKNPGFTALAVTCLALGIGVNTTIFSVVDGVLLKPFDFREPDRLVILEVENKERGWTGVSLSYPTMRDWQAQTAMFSQIGAFSGRSITVSDGRDEPERVIGGSVTASMFPMLGIEPILGRAIREDEDRPGAERVVLISHSLWTRRYAQDRGVIGKSVMINAAPHTIVGVMPPKFKFPSQQEAWVAMAPLHHTDKRDNYAMFTVARLKPGATLEQARAEIAEFSKRSAEQFPETAGFVGTIKSLRDEFIPDDISLVIWTMMGAVVFVLLIACANVANLMLARATARHREIAIRSAIGAGRGRIVRQLLTESVLIALMAGAIGIALAYGGLKLLTAAMPPNDVPYYIQWTIDRRVLLYTVVVAVMTGLIFGLAPAMQAAKTNLQEALKEGGKGTGAGTRRSRLRSSLVVFEVALSLVLLIGASLFVRSFLSLQNKSGGFDTGPIMTMRFFMPGEPYDSVAPKTQRVEDLMRRIEALPGVQAAAASNLIPMSAGGAGGQVRVDGSKDERGKEPRLFYAGVTPHWFKTLGVRVIEGRDFTEAEGTSRTAVAVVDETFAKKLFPGKSAVGQRFLITNDTAPGWFTIIGVSTPIITDDLDDKDPPEPSAFIPYPYMAARNTGIMIRMGGGNPASVTAGVRKELRAVDANLPLFDVQTMEHRREMGFWQYKLFGQMFGTFGAIALLLASIGVYGVISYSVQQRTQEIGVRMALGARGADVLRMVIRQGLTLAGIGIFIGLLGALGVTRVITSLLFVSATDPISFVGISLFLIAIAVVASWVPARRAMGVDPLVALRYD